MDVFLIFDVPKSEYRVTANWVPDVLNEKVNRSKKI